MPIGGKIKGLLELFEQLEDLLPIILKLVECFQKMSVEDQGRVKSLLVNHVSDEQKPVVEKLIDSVTADA